MNDARPTPSDGDSNPARRLRMFLRDHRVLDADVHVPRGQFLATYLASRTRYVNLTAVRWLGTERSVDHMALKVDHVLWSASVDGALELTGALASTSARRVALELEGGYVLAAGLLLTSHQRLTDYLQSAPPFVPLRDARLLPRGRSLGDIVINQQAIQVVREQDEIDGPTDEADEAPAAVVEQS